MVLLALATTAAAQGIASGAVKSGTLSFDGKGTGGDFVGTTSTVSGTMTGGATLADVQGYVEAPVNTLVTGNGRRDRDLNKSMESGQFPVIRFDLDRVEPRAGDTEATLGGRLTIHGVTRDVLLDAKLERSADAMRVRTDFPLDLTDYQIKGLSKFLGVFKMNKDIVVHVDVTFALH